MTEENTPKKTRRKRKAKEVAETPIVTPEPIPTPEPETEEAIEPETPLIVIPQTGILEIPEPVAPSPVKEVRASPPTYANPGGEYIENSFKRRRAERRARK
jgi:hypothetical protein